MSKRQSLFKSPGPFRKQGLHEEQELFQTFDSFHGRKVLSTFIVMIPLLTLALGIMAFESPCAMASESGAEAAAAVILNPESSYEQESVEPPGSALTLESCVAVALDKNPYYRATLEGIIAAREAALAAKASYYPEVYFQTGYRRFETHIFLPGDLSFPGLSTQVGPEDAHSISVSTGYTLYDSGLRKAQYSATLSNKKALEEQVSQSREEIIFAVHHAYFTLLASEEALLVARKNLKRSKEHLRMAEERKTAGAVPLADVLRTQVDASNAELALIQAEGNIKVAQGNLNTAMGLPADSALALAPFGNKVEPFDTSEPSVMLEQALLNRGDLGAAAKRVESRQALVTAARSAFGPRITAQASYGRLDSDYFPHDRDWAVGVTFQFPIYSFARSHNLARASSEMTREELSRQQLVLSIKQEVWTNISKVLEAWTSVSAAETLQRNAEESLRMAQERYQAGAGTVTDLLDAETNLAEADLTYVQTVYSYRVAVSRLKKSLGVLSS